VTVDAREVERIAALARLRFEKEEIERLTLELNRILGHVEALRGLAADVPPGEQRTPIETFSDLASTRPTESGTADALRSGPGAIAPAWSDGFFLVPPPPGVQHDDDATGTDRRSQGPLTP